jgi:23S rRNA pseudouridine955/2504/2580 synthase
MSGVEIIEVGEDEQDLRLDRWFKQRFPALGHGGLERLLRTGQVRVDGRRAKSGTRLAAGQVVRVPPLKTEPGSVSAPRSRPEPAISQNDVAALRAAVLFEDPWVLALNKPSGLAVQGGTGQTRHLDAMLGALGGEDSLPRLVHRLDQDTSGVLLLAKTATAARRLGASFKARETEKIYWALVVGAPNDTIGRIDLPLAKKAALGGEKVAPDTEEDGKAALTLYHVVETRPPVKRGGKNLTWLVLRPLTGRTHQLRVHCAAMGTPILADGKYGGRAAFVEGQGKRLMLHAREIAIPHPDDGTTLRVTAPLPPHMEEAWRQLGFDPRKGERAAGALVALAEGLSHSPPGTKPKPKRAMKQTGRRPAKRKAAKKATKKTGRRR